MEVIAEKNPTPESQMTNHSFEHFSVIRSVIGNGASIVLHDGRTYPIDKSEDWAMDPSRVQEDFLPPVDLAALLWASPDDTLVEDLICNLLSDATVWWRFCAPEGMTVLTTTDQQTKKPLRELLSSNQNYTLAIIDRSWLSEMFPIRTNAT